jgi:prepilin-type N-terminal cleavage/methylation domain-containing protein
MKLPLTRINRNKSQQGFTLIEMSVVVVITAVLITMSVNFALPLIEAAKRIETEQKIKLIKKALAEYAVQNNRIPCPATPLMDATYGFEAGNGTALGLAGFRCASNTGMIPFHTLGIPGTLAFDGWGNTLTYAVSPAFTLSSVAAQTSVHVKCRTREWFYANGRPIDIDATPPIIDVAPTNPEKAGFCCAGSVIGNDLQVLDQAGNNVLPLNRSSMVAGDLASAATPFEASIIDPTVYPSPTTTPLGIAYVLVSHGNDENGAYDVDTGARVGATTTACEGTNVDNNTSYQMCLEPADDILGFETSDAMFASEEQSCAGP